MEGDFASASTVTTSQLKNNMKFFGGNASNWGWADRLDDPQGNKHFATYNFTPGTYTLVLSGRSIRWHVDRIILWNSSMTTEAAAKNISNPESPRQQ